MTKIDILRESFEWLRFAGIVKTQKEFAQLVGMNESNMSRALNGDDKYLTDNLMSKVSARVKFYKEKEENTISLNHSPNSQVVKGNNNIVSHQRSSLPHDNDETQLVPIIPTNIYKETDINTLEYINENDVQMSPAVQQFPKTTCFYVVNTMAMYPHFHQGDILALKRISKNVPIVNGEVYAVDTIELGILFRFVYDRGDHIELRSDKQNMEHYESFRVPKADIYNLFRIVGLIRTNV